MPVDKLPPNKYHSYNAKGNDETSNAVLTLSDKAYKLWDIMLMNSSSYVFHENIMCERTGFSHSKYQRALKELKIQGYVTSALSSDKDGKQTYTLTVHDHSVLPKTGNDLTPRPDMVLGKTGNGLLTSTKLTSTNITSKRSSGGTTVEHVENVPVSSSQYEPTQNENQNVYEFAEVSFNRTKTDHPHIMTKHDEQILDECVSSFAENTDIKTAKRLVNLALAQVAVRPSVRYPMAYVKKIVKKMLNDRVTTVREARDAYQLRNRTGVSLAKLLKIHDDESYSHDDTDYDDLEYLLDSVSEFYDRQDNGEQVESSDGDDSLDIDEDNLPF